MTWKRDHVGLATVKAHLNFGALESEERDHKDTITPSSPRKLDSQQNCEMLRSIVYEVMEV